MVLIGVVDIIIMAAKQTKRKQANMIIIRNKHKFYKYESAEQKKTRVCEVPLINSMAVGLTITERDTIEELWMSGRRSWRD